MNYQVAILTEDTVFGRMLELEFQNFHLNVVGAGELNPADRADVVILDLDSATAPPPEQYRTVIGFSRYPAREVEDAGQCSLILRRPFQMSLLRREVLSQVDNIRVIEAVSLPSKKAGNREVFLNSKEKLLICDGEEISVSPQELRILECLLESRGEAVSRERLSLRVGPSAANKIEVFICYLRRKTDDLPGGRLILTCRGKGYMIP